MTRGRRAQAALRAVLLAVLGAGLLASPGHAQLPAVRDRPLTANERVRLTQLEGDISRIAGKAGASEKALRKIAASFGETLTRSDYAQLVALLEARAHDLADMQERLRVLEHAEDPAIAQLLTTAQAQIEDGKLDEADQTLQQAAQSDLAAIAVEEAQLLSRKRRAAETISERGKLALLRSEFDAAIILFGQAAATTPQTERQTVWRYSSLQAEAYFRKGAQLGNSEALAQSSEAYQSTVLPLADRARRPLDWAQTMTDLGKVLSLRGSRAGNTELIEQAVTDFRAALEERTQARDPLLWAATMTQLGDALYWLGARSYDARLLEAADAYSAALSKRTRAASPEDWASTQYSLATTLNALGAREANGATLAKAEQAIRASLEVRTRQSAPQLWGSSQNVLGNILRDIGERESGVARLQAAVDTHNAALLERQRDRVPVQWATTKNNIGNALRVQGEHLQDPAILRASIQNYEEALLERTRAKAAAQWAITEDGLGSAKAALGDLTHDVGLLNEATTLLQEALSERPRTRVPSQWAASQHNLCRALEATGRLTRSAETLTRARATCEAALEERKQAETPLEWARSTLLLSAVVEDLADLDPGPAQPRGYAQARELADSAAAVFRAGRADWFISRAQISLTRLAGKTGQDASVASAH